MKNSAAQTITRFLTGTSLSILMAAPALADASGTFVVQDGIGNTARIDQDYRTGVTGIGGNQFPGSNTAGRVADPIRQTGDRNVLTIFQGGIRGHAGTSDKGLGIDQTGDRNTLTITQIGKPNRVNQVQQTGAALAGTAQNTATVIQTNTANDVENGAHHKVSSIVQTNTGGVDAVANVVHVEQVGASSFVGRKGSFGLSGGGEWTALDGIVQDGSGNGATVHQRDGRAQTLRLIDQDGIANTALTYQEAGDRNVIGAIVQAGTESYVHIGQYGSDNTFDLIDQSGGGAGTLANSVDLTFAGDGNGAAFTADGFADLGAPASTVTQLGTGNTLALGIDGDFNAFGALQNGDDNVIGALDAVTGTIATVAIVGSGNALSVAQTSSGNTVDIALFTGDRNVVGIAQSDAVGIAGSNTVTLSLDGSDNAFRIHQDGTSTIDLTIDGDTNGGTAAFSGVAAALRTATTAYDLSPGILSQTGAGNTIALTVRGDAGGVGTGNLFAIVQDGGDNRVDGLQAGIGNEVAILQAGSFNAVTFTQQGSFNVLAVSQ